MDQQATMREVRCRKVRAPDLNLLTTSPAVRPAQRQAPSAQFHHTRHARPDKTRACPQLSSPPAWRPTRPGWNFWRCGVSA